MLEGNIKNQRSLICVLNCSCSNGCRNQIREELREKRKNIWRAQCRESHSLPDGWY